MDLEKLNRRAFLSGMMVTAGGLLVPKPVQVFVPAPELIQGFQLPPHAAQALFGALAGFIYLHKHFLMAAESSIGQQA